MSWVYGRTFAKRALARGDDPEEVIRRIADYRGDEKHDPIYYARLTVIKARAQLEKRSDHAQPETAERIDVKHGFGMPNGTRNTVAVRRHR